MVQIVLFGKIFFIGIQKSGTYYCVPLFINKCQTFVQIKKAGLRAAVPLYEALVLPFYSEQATPKSTPNMYVHACT